MKNPILLPRESSYYIGWMREQSIKGGRFMSLAKHLPVYERNYGDTHLKAFTRGFRLFRTSNIKEK